MQFLGWINHVEFEGQQHYEARDAVNNVSRFGVFEFPWQDPQAVIDRLPAILAAGNGEAAPGLGDLIPAAGPYSHLAELVLLALRDHKITAAEAGGLALEIGHVTGAEAKVRDLVGGLLARLTGGK